MAGTNHSKRPLSPHLQVYRPQISSVMSILHRVTGVGLAFGAILVVWWFLAAASGPDYFDFIDGLLTSWIGGLVMIGLLAAFWYHFFNGIRHLTWDAGYGYEVDMVTKTGIAALVATGVLSVITVIAAFL